MFALAGNRTRGYCLEGNNVTTTPPGLIGPTEIRTRVTGFKVRCANPYTMEPFVLHKPPAGIEPAVFRLHQLFI